MSGGWVTRYCTRCQRKYECREGGKADQLGLCAPCALDDEAKQ